MQYPAGQKHTWWAFAIDEWDLALSEAKRMAAEPNTQVGINLVYFDRPHEEKVTVWNSKKGIL
jgi:hypothetical protein